MYDIKLSSFKMDTLEGQVLYRNKPFISFPARVAAKPKADLNPPIIRFLHHFDLITRIKREYDIKVSSGATAYIQRRTYHRSF